MVLFRMAGIGAVGEETRKLRQLVEPLLASKGVELVDLECKKEGTREVLRVYIDKSGGVTLDLCGEVSELIGPMLDAADVLQGRYYLEVSSPGINRPLSTRDDFVRFIDSKVRLVTSAPIGGKTVFRGRLTGVQSDEVLVETGNKRQWRIPLGSLVKANLDDL